MILLFTFGLLILVVSLTLLWIVIPAFFGPPSVPTDIKRIRQALQLANLKSGETLYDLGAGDGRVLLIAAREFGARAVGIEIGPVQCALIYARVAANGFSEKIQIKWDNYFKTSLNEADVIFIYATSQEISKLAEGLKQRTKPGARIVSISADFTEWEPSIVDESELIFIYEMPPKEGNYTTYRIKQSA